MQKNDALIAGAGPTGLVLALWLTRLGVRVRIIDKAPEPGQNSRAVGVQARTLELYRQMGLADLLVARGLPAAAANLWVKGKHEAHLEFGAMGKGQSPFPYMLIYPQDEHEKLLIEHLARAGVQVERPTDLLDFEDKGDRITARLRREGGSVELCEADYLAGCDGARSSVRQGLRIEYRGATYGHLFYVADVEASGPQMNGELHIALDDGDFLACFPLDRAHTRARIIGALRRGAHEHDALDWTDVSPGVLERIALTVARVNWFSTYRVHHRVASSFRVGRAFLLGDAAHIHSPVGGQGMNTGIGDAINLAWKLASALRDRADSTILDSYEAERAPFAKRLVATTDRVFELVSAEGPIVNSVRVGVAPHLLAMLFRSATVRRLLFGTISQIKVNYRGTPLSEGRAGRVRGGDRLPWVASSGGADNFEPLASLGWQAHVYGSEAPDLRKTCESRNVPLHVFPWAVAAESAGLAKDAVYLVRPDAYVAMAAAASEAAQSLTRYLETRNIRPS